MPSTTVQYFPFGKGLHEENDNRLQIPGAPRAIENLIRTKNSRLVPRRDYETIANTGTGSNSGGGGSFTNLRLYDLAEYNGRLVGFGRVNSNVVSINDAESDALQFIFDFVEQPTGNWRRAQTAEIGQGSLARFIGRTGYKASSIVDLDVAATGGRVCMVMGGAFTPDLSTQTVAVHIIDAATDTTLANFAISGAEKPRVVAVGGVFYVAAVVTSSGAVTLRKFDPSTDNTPVTLSDPVAAGASVTALDMKASLDENSFWIGVARSDTTTVLRGLDAAGAVTFSAAGPAVLADAITVFHHLFGTTSTLHVALRINSTNAVDLHKYNPPTTTPVLSDTDILSPATSECQPGLAIDAVSDTALRLSAVDPRGSVYDTIIRNIRVTDYFVLGTSFCTNAPPNSKPEIIKRRCFINTTIEEESNFFTHALMRTADDINVTGLRPVCVFDHFLGHNLNPNHLPSIAFDSSTEMAYVAVSEEAIDRVASPKILEISLCSTERRQTAQLGDVLYIAGAVVQSYDGRHLHEAGGFLTRPYIVLNQIEAASGADPDLSEGGSATYQSIAVMQYVDAKGRRILSGPSNIVESNPITGFETFNINVDPPVSFRDFSSADTVTPDELQSAPSLLHFRTLNTDDGNGTFHLDSSTAVGNLASRDTVNDVEARLTNAELAEQEILYTQGARGALSGPLEFVCPDPCVSLAASSDRILSAGLIEETRIQESRPLFVGEQVQWSDTLGFYRDIRARTLAVVRLDERRIIFTATEIFESDGPGLDDNGLGDIGPPRRLPSDVGLHGGRFGWRSIVEVSAGIIFQGLPTQLYLLPRGGVTPSPIGFAVEDKLAAYPVIKAAVYMNEDQTVRFCCENEGGTESIVLLLNLRFMEWFVEGPYAFGIRSAAKAGGRFYLLNSLNVLQRQTTSSTPTTFIGTAWRSGVMHPFNPAMYGRVYAFWFFGTFRGNCRIRAIVTWLDENESETHDWVDVTGLSDGDQFAYRFEFERLKCESCMIDFEVTDLHGEATAGLDYNYGAIECESSGVPMQLGPEGMS